MGSRSARVSWGGSTRAAAVYILVAQQSGDDQPGAQPVPPDAGCTTCACLPRMFWPTSPQHTPDGSRVQHENESPRGGDRAERIYSPPRPERESPRLSALGRTRTANGDPC